MTQLVVLRQFIFEEIKQGRLISQMTVYARNQEDAWIKMQNMISRPAYNNYRILGMTCACMMSPPEPHPSPLEMLNETIRDEPPSESDIIETLLIKANEKTDGHS